MHESINTLNSKYIRVHATSTRRVCSLEAWWVRLSYELCILHNGQYCIANDVKATNTLTKSERDLPARCCIR